jgi:hypothetical protein
VSAASKGMIKPTAQPGMGYMSVNKGDETIRPTGHGDPVVASAVGKSSNEDSQPEPIAHGIERTCDQSRESAEEQEDVGADWRQPLLGYLRAPDGTVDQKIHRQTLKYTLMEGELYRRMMDGLLLKCLNKEQAKVAMGEVHEGMCGVHQSAQKMKWVIQWAGLYWPSMVDDCIRYKRGCEAC